MNFLILIRVKTKDRFKFFSNFAAAKKTLDTKKFAVILQTVFAIEMFVSV